MPAIRGRLKRGWSAEQALTVPVGTYSARQRIITFNGETRTRAAWARILGMNYETLRERLNRGWSVEKAFTTPPRLIGPAAAEAYRLVALARARSEGAG